MREVIVKYSGDVAALGYQTEILNENYAILTVPEADAAGLDGHPQIEYVEPPKRLTLSLYESSGYACVPAAQSAQGYGLRGAGVLIAVIDSGIDYCHADFRNADGTSRVLYLWDQTLPGTPPQGFLHGAEFSNAQLNAALDGSAADVPHRDTLGHGTAVAGVAAGSGRASDGLEVGVAPEAALLVVKLGERDDERAARTTEIMRAVKYAYDKAALLDMPLAVNLSYGTNDGPHDGQSLFETYIDSMAEKGKSVFVAAMGNEGAARHHFQYTLRQDETLDIPFSVAGNLPELTLTLWKNFTDTFTIEVIDPSGGSTGTVTNTAIPRLIHLDGVGLRILYVQPSHYNQHNAVSLNFQAMSSRSEITPGVWTLRVRGRSVTDGLFHAWLPTAEEVTDRTAFLSPSAEVTLTLPACAEKVISVGGYDAATGAFAVFSGSGYTRGTPRVKPDLCAPAVNIRAPRAGGGYATFTGTSLAAPFVTGGAALMMQWGILKGNDPFLYGQRVKAFLHKGAKRVPSLRYPNPRWGYGSFCLSAALDALAELR